ncbi:MAG: carboxymuconolactone decarboxylase family protein, partial [Chloroflexi bacterium]|nr:carboxymuconolactone decarboxylase family protein [Chloroflexota bacterium]
QTIDDGRLSALRDFTHAVVEKRGRVAEDEVKAFLDAGFTKAQVLEVILAAAFKLISNYTNHVADIPLDEAFQAYRWDGRKAA